MSIRLLTSATFVFVFAVNNRSTMFSSVSLNDADGFRINVVLHKKMGFVQVLLLEGRLCCIRTGKVHLLKHVNRRSIVGSEGRLDTRAAIKGSRRF